MLDVNKFLQCAGFIAFMHLAKIWSKWENFVLLLKEQRLIVYNGRSSLGLLSSSTQTPEKEVQ